MKQPILAGLAVGLILGCAEPATVQGPPVGPKAQYSEEGPQYYPGEPVPSEYNVPTAIAVGAGGGFTEIGMGNEAYGQAVVNYTGTHGLAKATLEVDGYPDAHGEAQRSSLLPTSNSVSVYARRMITETCGKSSRTEATGWTWNEFVSSSVLSWGKKSDSDTYTAFLDACVRPPGGGIPYCDWYQLEYSYDGGETWYESGGPQWLCPGDEFQWATRKVRSIDPTRPATISTARASQHRPVKKQASILFIGTHYLEVNAHAFVQSGAKFGVDAVVIVDTMRASQDDLEAAILAAAYHINTAPLGVSQRIAVAKSGTRLTGAAKTRAAERARPILQATKQSRGQLTVAGWTGRALKTTVNLPPVRSAKDSQ